ncbi:uncharacterized protein LOC142337184 [Convolutriloba macropyga]|uniref:uncharacterized protein LOC142337184 n=1 Tax=Convolutriloba macropyga TaxID=536237 RepID=UPI003F51E523
MDPPGTGPASGASYPELCQAVAREYVWSTQKENTTIRYFYLEEEYQNLFDYRNKWVDSAYPNERLIPRNLASFLLQNILVGPGRDLDTTSQLYYHTGCNFNAEAVQTWYKFDGSILVLDPGKMETSKDYKTAAPPERSEEEEEEQEGEEELINHFLMVIYHGFFRYDGVKLYAVPGGYITNADSVESILWDDQFQLELSELSRQRCLNQLQMLCRKLYAFDNIHYIGDVSNPLSLQTMKLPTMGTEKWRNIRTDVDNQVTTIEYPKQLEGADLFFCPVECLAMVQTCS